ncbi:MAG: L,D-transpeptidase, partial [Gammaproteobacteria bacterium]|nr:L,D-transpeptidase [Gammaproteobacteria bacterium]
NMPIFSVFCVRKPTGEIWSEALEKQFPERDWILSRILWLHGPQTSLDRYIYIHGTNDEKNIQTPNSHGCIRMINADVINLFEKVSVGEEVFIE